MHLPFHFSSQVRESEQRYLRDPLDPLEGPGGKAATDFREMVVPWLRPDGMIRDRDRDP